jgi:hypothetical protein
VMAAHVRAAARACHCVQPRRCTCNAPATRALTRRTAARAPQRAHAHTAARACWRCP